LAKDRERKYFVLATELYNLFPEIKVLKPQLKIDNFLETDGLEKETRSIDNYEEVVEMKVDGGIRHKLFKGKWDGRECVLKRFQFTNTRDIRAFRREVQMLIRLKHPNIAEIECFFLDEENQLGFIQLPFYDGGNLSEWQAKHKQPNFQICFIISEILKGIESIHAAGFIHCDLKPQNILMTQEGHPKIADLEISKDQIFGNQSTFIGGYNCIHFSSKSNFTFDISPNIDSFSFFFWDFLGSIFK